MTSPISYNLTVKLSALIETPPSGTREQFRESAIRTLLSVTKSQDVSVEYIGYKPDPIGIHHLDSPTTEFEDSVFASLVINHSPFLMLEDGQRKDDFLKAFIETFESKTHRHLEVDSTFEDDSSHDIEIEMSSDWKLYLRQG